MTAAVLDLEAFAVAVADRAAAVVEARIEAAVERALSRQRETLEPLAEILGVSRAAANMRLSRDPALRALGVRSGKRIVFQRSAVLAYLAAQGRK